MKTDRPTTKNNSRTYKGKVLGTSFSWCYRSSKSMLKESLFNVLQFDIIDKIL